MKYFVEEFKRKKSRHQCEPKGIEEEVGKCTREGKKDTFTSICSSFTRAKFEEINIHECMKTVDRVSC